MTQKDNTEKKELWEEFNNLKTEEMACYSRHSILNHIRQFPTTIEEKKRIEKEFDLACLYHNIAQRLFKFDPDKKDIQNDIEQFRLRCGNGLDFYKQRLAVSKTDLLIGHYSLACFVLEGKTHMQNVFKQTLEQSIFEFEHSSKYNFVSANHLLIMAFNLNNLYGLKQEEILNKTVLKFLEKMNFEAAVLMESCLEIILRLSIIDDKKIEKIIKYGIENYDNLKHLHMKERVLLKIVNLCNSNETKYKETKNDVFLKIATLYEDESEENEEIFLKIINLEKARNYHDKLNNKNEIQDINKKIMELTPQISWTVNETKITLKPIEIRGNTNTERVQHISNVNIIPNKEQLEQQIKNNNNEFSIQALFTKKPFEKTKPSNEKSDIGSELMRESIFHVQYMENVLSISVEKLEKDNLIKSEDYFDFIKSFGLYDISSLEIIKQGIKRHFAGDFISSIHVLIPQIEGTLRKILEEKGFPITEAKKDIKLVLLKDIIKKCETENIFDKNLIHYLKVKFGDNEGMNQRNDVSHAFLSKISDFNHTSSLALIYIIMRLLVLK